MTRRRVALRHAAGLLAVGLVFLSGCGGGTTGITFTNYVFEIFATTGYSGELVEDSGTTPVSGSSDQNITITPVSGQQYTLTLTKNASDGQPLELELVGNGTVNGIPTVSVIDTETTTDPNTPVRETIVD